LGFYIFIGFSHFCCNILRSSKEKIMPNKGRLPKKFVIPFLLLMAVCAIGAGGAYAMVSVIPSMGAQIIDLVRTVVGQQTAAQFENTVLSGIDSVHQIKARVLGTTAPVVGWGPSLASSDSQAGKGTFSIVNKLLSWQPASIAPISGVQGEGQWQPYIQNGKGEVVAYRTFLVPDPTRPYAFVAVVAFDLNKTALHFQIGTDEPKSQFNVIRTGSIPAADLQPGILLAAFNGGFKTEHGHFGVMFNHKDIIAPRAGMATVGFYDDGSIKIGLWGKDIVPSKHLVSWRQNGPPVIENGVVSPLTGDPKYWGYTINDTTATYRSGLATSRDNKTLYYVVGSDITLATLAKALSALEVYQAMQLDINNYWVHFEAFGNKNGQLAAIPLLDFMKGPGDHRFLQRYSRDFFYLTSQ
jgi:hypothetical protein